MDAQFAGAEASGWDDEGSKPDWAKDRPGDEDIEDIEDIEDHPPDEDDHHSEEEDIHPENEDLHSEEDGLPTEDASTEAEPVSGEWEDLKPERRRLVGFMALLMSERKPNGSPPEQQAGLAGAQVSIILDWEKIRSKGSRSRCCYGNYRIRASKPAPGDRKSVV